MNRGLVYAGLGFVCWGLFPLYFRQLAAVPAVEVLVHRVVWSLAFLLLLLLLRREWAWVRQVVRQPRLLGTFVLTALLLSVNWVTYIWAVSHGHVVDASLGYFMTPLVNVALGCTVLHERLRLPQWSALGLALLGVLWLTWEAGRLPWIALVLASSFGVYGLLRKVATLGALEGLTLETVILAPMAFGALLVLGMQGGGSFPSSDAMTNLFLVGIGPVTAVPLLLFAAGARRLSMATLGIVQYVSPTLQFLIGILVFHEPFSNARLVGFACIWTALLLYTIDGWRQARRTASALEPA